MTPATVGGEEVQIPYPHRVLQFVPNAQEHQANGTIKLIFPRDADLPEPGSTVAITIEEVD